MADSTNQDINSDPPPAVKSLRSKFENLALGVQDKPRGNQGYLAPDSATVRPRAASSLENPPVDARHLRSSSSSSDLNVALKRPPPPPPPPRSAKAPSPSPSVSPLLRPVPIPTVAANNNRDKDFPFNASKMRISPVPFAAENEGVPLSPLDNVTLHDKFSNSSVSSSSTHIRRPSNTEAVPTSQSEHTSLNQGAPAIPPRPSKHVELSHGSPLPQSRPDGVHQATSGVHYLFDIGHADTDNSATAAHLESVGALNAPNYHGKNDFDGEIESQPSGSSSNSGDSNPHLSGQLAKPARRGVPPPPRPPLRPQTTTSSVSNSSLASHPPPPLPSRRSPNTVLDEAPSTPPRLPVRPTVTPISGFQQDSSNGSPTLGRLGDHKLPPPPTRTIALGGKLPPARRPPSPSSEDESGDEDDMKRRIADSLPDSSHSFRQPPELSVYAYKETKISIPAYTGHFAVSGEYVVVATQHHVKLFNLSKSDSCLYSLDGKDVGLKDIKVTAMQLRSAANLGDRGFLLWLGTKDGHLIELDIRTMAVVDTKFVAHSNSISHIFRYGRSMVTLDLNGKLLVFTPEGQEDARLGYTQPKVVRIAEKQDFAKLFSGRLWTSARSDMNGVGGVGKVPLIRVYDIFSPGCPSRVLSPTDPVGAVTAGTVLPSQPNCVYLSHEGGFVSLWSTDTDDGFPQFTEVIKVAVSDIVCLEGVNERLWAGGRNGMISAFDVTSRPWVVTNCWVAHGELPVMSLSVDHYGIQRTGDLPVISVGRDEHIRFWDGWLGVNWIDQELQKRAATFSRLRNLTLLVISWNVDATRPDALTMGAANPDFVQEALQTVDFPDIIAFGLQEVIDLESRKMTAKNVLLGSKKEKDGGLSEKVSTGYKKWHDHFLHAVRLAMPAVSYTVTHAESLVGLFSCVLVKKSDGANLQDVATTTVKRGMGGRYGNKGAIVSRFVIDDSSLCMVNCHLAAGQHHVRQRNADIAAILEDTTLPTTRSGDPVAYAGGGNGSMVLDHEIVIFSGDMNYRIEQRRESVVSAIHAGEYDTLLLNDQLLKEMKQNRGFRLRHFMEGPLTFAPTYKYDPRSSEYDTSEKSRVPAWCDRILWRSIVPSRVQQLSYRRYEANPSDHRPISAGFALTVKSIRHDIRADVKAEVEARWIGQQERLVSAALRFYVSQALL